MASSSSQAVVPPAATAALTLEALTWDNQAIQQLPVDPVKENYVRTVNNACFSLVEPTPVKNPRLVVASESALAWINVAATEIARPDFAEYFSGNKLLPGARPAAHCYCGHQFGSFAGQLGDGATMYLGEILTCGGERVELQFKGAGKTPYSRTADGRKVLRSSIREFVCSELMAALGVPTTRAGTVVTSDTLVERDIFYSGDVIMERATVITRLAPTFLRFGSFEIFKPTDATTGRAGPSAGNRALLEQLAGFVLRQYYPEIAAKHASEPPASRFLRMYEEIVRRSARLVACWQAYGWCHGVLNTDNMSIVGATIDYGPFGWLDRFDPGFICNTSDTSGRYSYENQPHAVQWNCLKLGEMLAPLFEGADWRRAGSLFELEFQAAHRELLARKLGLLPFETVEDNQLDSPAAALVCRLPPFFAFDDSDGVVPVPGSSGLAAAEAAAAAVDAVVEGLYGVMASAGLDYTNTFRALSRVDPHGADETKAAAGGGEEDPILEYLLTQACTVAELTATLAPRMPKQQLQMLIMLAQTNPRLAAQLDGLEDELARHDKYERAARLKPEQKIAADRAAVAEWLATYRVALKALAPPADNHAAVRMFNARRQKCMQRANPKYVLRNWIAHQAILAAEKGDFDPVRKLLARMQDPYGIHDGGMESAADAAYATAPGSGGGDATAASATCGNGGGGSGGGGAASGGDEAFTCKPPPWALDLKVT